MTFVSRMTALSLLALSIQGCSPDKPDDKPVAPASVAAAPATREDISVNEGVRTRKVYAIKDGIEEITLEENTKDGKLHGVQYKFAKGRLVEEIHYEKGEKVRVRDQEWIDEMNDVRSENCVLEKTPEYADPRDPPMSQAMLDQWNARCNERPFASEAAANRTQPARMQITPGNAGAPLVKNGIVEKRDPATGNIVKTQEFRNGALLASKEWTNDGKTLIADIRWVDGRENGWEKRRAAYHSGELEVDWVWKDGVLSGFSAQHEKGKRDRTDVKDGIRTRKIHELHEGADILVMEETYKGYKRDGMHREYSDGKLVTETEYRNGKPVRSTDASVLEEFDEDLAFELCTNMIANEYRGDKNAGGTIPEAIYADWERQCSD